MASSAKRGKTKAKAKKPRKRGATGGRKAKSRVSTPKEESAESGEVVVELVDGDAELAVDDDRVIEVEASVVSEGDEALSEVEPVTDDELEAIESDLVKDLARRRSAKTSSTTALARRDPMAAYMAEVRRHPLLTREEEYELAVRWVENDDQEAGRLLVTSNLRLVVKIAHEYKRTYTNLLDLVQEGNVGLIKAVQKFDPYRNVKLSTYAGWWIKAYILKFILNNWRLVKIGTTQNQRKLFFNLRKQQARLKQAGIDPTPERIARELDVSTKEVIEMERRLSSPDASLNAPLGSDDDSGRTRMDVIEDTRADPEADVDAAQFKELLAEKLRRFGSTLRGRELEIFSDRLMSDEPATLQSLGSRWGVSRERARQLEKRMVLRLRKFLQDELGDAVQIALGHE